MKPLFSVLAAATAVLALAPTTRAQAVDYPDSTLSSPPELFFPFYTLGSGGTVRYQTILPSTFQGLPAQPTLVTKVGLPIAGEALYTTFEIRFGASPRQTLNNFWTDNLPDQRVQVDLSGEMLPGGVAGGAPINRWVEFDLAHPFLWNPGESLVLDIVSSAASPGNWCQTTVHQSGERLYDAPYSFGASGRSLSTTNCMKFRVVFDTATFPTYGQGCAGSGGFTPAIAASGSPTLGSIVPITATGLLGGAPVGRLLGFSRAQAPFGDLPFGLRGGGACAILNSVDSWELYVANGTGAGQGDVTSVVIVPNDGSLVGVNAFFQFAVVDPAAASPVALSEGLVFHVR